MPGWSWSCGSGQLQNLQVRKNMWWLWWRCTLQWLFQDQGGCGFRHRVSWRWTPRWCWARYERFGSHGRWITRFCEKWVPGRWIRKFDMMESDAVVPPRKGCSYWADKSSMMSKRFQRLLLLFECAFQDIADMDLDAPTMHFWNSWSVALDEHQLYSY